MTPHASFLALEYAPRQALDNLAKLRTNLDAYGTGGFYDAIAVRSGNVAKHYLALDQGMIMGALGNYLGHNLLRNAFTAGPVQRTVRPLLSLETLTSPSHFYSNATTIVPTLCLHRNDRVDAEPVHAGTGST